MSKPLVCVDLDRTVIYSPNAMALPMPDTEAPRLLCVEVYQGKPLSFITEAAAGLLAELAEESHLVPVTTRTPEQLARVHLPIPATRARYAIAANGGHLIVDGAPDPAWDATVAAAISACAPVDEVHRHLLAVSDDQYVDTVRVASGLFVYAVVQRAHLPSGWVADLTGYAAERGWRVSVQGRKVYLVPVPLTKSAVLNELKRRTGAESVLAAGDSLLDRDLLEAADLAVRPAAGELAEANWLAPHVTALQRPGILGGEDLIGWLLNTVRNHWGSTDR